MDRQSDLDNHANQLNPNNDAYWDSRGYDDRPGDWDEETPESDVKPEKAQRSESKNQPSKK
jgi:hypothetical protein